MNSFAGEKYRALVCDPEAWRKAAMVLVKAASLLKPAIAKFWEAQKARSPIDDGLLAVHFMLSAYALENLMKERWPRKSAQPDKWDRCFIGAGYALWRRSER